MTHSSILNLMLLRNLLSPIYPILSLIFFLVFCFSLISFAIASPPDSSTSPKTVRNIIINIRDIFEQPNSNLIYNGANQLKINTQEEVIYQELLLKEGDEFNEFLMQESERRLRALRYLRNASITPKYDQDFVDLMIDVQDTWTLIPQLSFSSGDGRKSRSAGFAESNLLGLGKRLEVSYEEDEAREIIEGVFDDTRVFGSDKRFLGAFFQRSDGEQSVLYFGKPIRTLADTFTWYLDAAVSDTVGRLFKDGEEEYIYRQESNEFNSRLSVAYGNPEKEVRRYSVGLDYVENQFEQADADDYNDLDLDPGAVSNDPLRLAHPRRYSGPVFNFEHIKPDFISMNYIDRFDRVEDYNLGDQYDFSLFFAPESFGSREDTLLFSVNKSRGIKFSSASFLRGEMGLGSRLDDDGFSNSLARAELKYFNVLGNSYLGDMFLGKHTLAASLFIDYGDDLDLDRQFLLGGDNALRGYKARSFVGDKRIALNLEDRAHFIDDAYQLVSVGAAAFLDVGGASYDSFGSLLEDDIYADVGVGLRFAFPRSSGGRVLRVDLALPLREAEDGSNALELRIIVTGGQLFSSRLRSESFGPEKANVAVGFDK